MILSIAGWFLAISAYQVFDAKINPKIILKETLQQIEFYQLRSGWKMSFIFGEKRV